MPYIWTFKGLLLYFSLAVLFCGSYSHYYFNLAITPDRYIYPGDLVIDSQDCLLKKLSKNFSSAKEGGNLPPLTLPATPSCNQRQ